MTRLRSIGPATCCWMLLLGPLLAGSALMTGHAQEDPVRVRPGPERSLVPESGAELAVRWWCDYPLVEATIDGRGPFMFLVDTGASVCVVDLDLALLLGGPVAPSDLRALGAEGRGVGVGGVLSLGELRSENLILRGLHAVVLDLDPVTEALRTPLDGVLGYGAFAGLLLELDYPGRKVRARRGALPEPDGRGVLELAPGSVPRLPLRVGGEEVLVTLDSGSGGALELADWPAGADPLFGPLPDLGIVTIAGLSPPREIARLGVDISLGEHLVREPVARRTGGDARLGTHLLRHFTWTFDSASRRVRIERESERPVELGPVRSSGLALSLREDGLHVWAVLPGSPAETAGVRAGDRVLRLNERSAAELGPCDALGELVDESGRLEASLERAGRRLEIAFDVLVLLP